MVQSMMLVRAGHENELVADFVERGLIAVGWMKLGDLSRVESALEIEQMMLSVYPEGWTAAGRPSKHYAEIIQFALETKPGDLAITSDRARRQLVVGTIDGPYTFLGDKPLHSRGEPYRHSLPVAWEFAVARDALSSDVFRDTDQRGKTAFWLRPGTVEAILAAPRSSLDAYSSSRRRTARAAEPRPMSAAPVDGSVEGLLVWMDENERFAELLAPEVLSAKAAAADPAPRRAPTSTTTFVRDSFVAARAKQLADGVCDLCAQPAPFMSANGRPYLESHHVDWLSKGGRDALDNVVALCPNCHRKMHVRNERADVERLRRSLGGRS